MFLLTMLFFLMATAVWPVGQPSFFDYSLGLDIGLKNGTVEELVYENDQLISKLSWPLSVSPFLGVELNVNIRQFFITCRYSSAISIKNGSMEDFDYLTPYENTGSGTKSKIFTVSVGFVLNPDQYR